MGNTPHLHPRKESASTSSCESLISHLLQRAVAEIGLFPMEGINDGRVE